jgi:hypothetical protein
MLAEKEHEIAVNLPTIDDRRKDHAHETKTSGIWPVDHRRPKAGPSNEPRKPQENPYFSGA